MPRVIRIGTRSTKLALWQAEHVAARLRTAHAGLSVEVVPMSTRGDRHSDVPIPQIGTKGVFTQELEAALHARTIDLAVHSAKDLASVDPPGLALLAVPPRENPYDAWLSARGELADLPPGSRIGTSSPRRIGQLRHARMDLEFVPLRGAVDSRVRRVLDEHELDGMVLAMAGLIRLGLGHRVRRVLTVEECVPAPGQGVLGLQGRIDDAELRTLLAALHHEDTAAELYCERRVVERLGATCTTPLGVLARAVETALHCRACLASPDGSARISVSLVSGIGGWDSLADRVATQLQRSGADELIQDSANDPQT